MINTKLPFLSNTNFHTGLSIFQRMGLLAVNLIWMTGILYGQWTSAHPGMEWRSLTTGRTTGHVIDLFVTNTTDQAQTLEIGPFYIPGPGQPYVTEGPQVITVAANAGQTVPVNAYCFVDDILPARAGTPSDVTKWLTPDDVTMYDPQTDFARIPGFKPVDISDYAVIPKVPGYEVPLTYSLANIGSHPGAAASLAFAALDQLQQACSDLQATGNLLTPFGFDPAREEQAAIQHGLWMFSEAVEGRPFDPQNLERRVIREFESVLDRPFDQLAATTQQEIRHGIGQFREAFMDVGSAAMVINPGETWYTDKFCICDKMSYSIIVYKITGGKIGTKGSVAVSDNFKRSTLKKTITGMNLQKGDRIMVFVTEPALTCRCSDGSAVCNPFDIWTLSCGTTSRSLKIKEVPLAGVSAAEKAAEGQIAEKIKDEEKMDSETVSGPASGSGVFEVKSNAKAYIFPYQIKVKRDCSGEDCGGLAGYKECISTVALKIK